jgi:2-oxoglutarate ferredoxin oxidoreductase subunit beta
MVSRRDYASPIRPTWCIGCGNFGTWNALKSALAEVGLSPHEVLIVSGIGCGSKLPDYTQANGFNTIHGRPLAVATGAQLANHSLKIICTHGDGDSFGLGMGHLIHACRRNIALVDIIQDNQVYGLTKGQYSPTSDRGYVTPTSPGGAIERRANPILLALSAGATFVARGFARDLKHLTWLMAQALQHRGYAMVDVMQPCVTYNRKNTYDWYDERAYKLQEAGHDTSDYWNALEVAQQWGERIPVGIFFQREDVMAYHEELAVLEAGPLAHQPLGGWSEQQMERLIEEYI